MNTKETRPCASIIIIAYNEEKTIERALKSACEQTAKDIEIVCVDDGSADATYERMINCAARDSRIKIIKQPNGGTLAARCAGIRQATGVYSLFLDADDLLSPDAVQTACDAADAQGADVLEFGVDFLANPEQPPKRGMMQMHHRQFSQKLPLPTHAKSADLIHACFAEQSIPAVLWNKAYRTELLQAAVQYEQRERLYLVEDALITLMVLCRTKRYARIPTKLYVHVVGGGISASKTKFTPAEAEKQSKAIWMPVRLAREWLQKSGYPQDTIASGLTAYFWAIRGIAIQLLTERCTPECRPIYLNTLLQSCTEQDAVDLMCDMANRIEGYENAFFWKISAPLRKLLDRLKR